MLSCGGQVSRPGELEDAGYLPQQTEEDRGTGEPAQVLADLDSWSHHDLSFPSLERLYLVSNKISKIENLEVCPR